MYHCPTMAPWEALLRGTSTGAPQWLGDVREKEATGVGNTVTAMESSAPQSWSLSAA